MKNELAKYIARCFECQQVKTEHQHWASLLHPLSIPSWKWEIISLYFITVLPRNQNQNDSIMVVIEKLDKATHFIPVKTTHMVSNIAEIFMKQIFCLHGIPKVIIFDIDPKFTGNLWKSLFKGLNTIWNFGTSFHPQMDGHTKRVNQILEDMLRMYVKEQPGKWEDYLHLVEFAYNNHYQASGKYNPFEILYGRKCNTHISRSNPVDRLVLGPEMLKVNRCKVT